MDQDPAAARILSRIALSEGFLKLYRYTIEVRTHRGGRQRIERELMERGNAVAVLPYDPRRDAVLLGNEFRPGALVSGDNPFREQLFAGAMEPGESPIDAAIRELREESGLTLRGPQLIHPGAYVSSGGTSEKIALVFGLVDADESDDTIHGSDADEDVLTVAIPALQFVASVLDGRFNDLKTLVAGHWFAARHTRLRDAR